MKSTFEVEIATIVGECGHVHLLIGPVEPGDVGHVVDFISDNREVVQEKLIESVADLMARHLEDELP